MALPDDPEEHFIRPPPFEPSEGVEGRRVAPYLRIATGYVLADELRGAFAERDVTRFECTIAAFMELIHAPSIAS